jgi:hypothetical protein
VLNSPKADLPKAEAHFARAFDRPQQQAPLLGASRSGEPRALLARSRPVYGWFTEGFDTLDLREAKTLLNALEL